MRKGGGQFLEGGSSGSLEIQGSTYLFEVFFFSMEMNIYTLNIKTTQYPRTMTFMCARDTKKSNN